MRHVLLKLHRSVGLHELRRQVAACETQAQVFVLLCCELDELMAHRNLVANLIHQKSHHGHVEW